MYVFIFSLLLIKGYKWEVDYTIFFQETYTIVSNTCSRKSVFMNGRILYVSFFFRAVAIHILFGFKKSSNYSYVQVAK